MKFRHYLKALKIYSLLNIILGIVVFIAFLVSIKNVYEVYVVPYSAKTIVNHIYAITQILLSLPLIIEGFIVALIGFFIAKNFMIVYGNLKRFFS